MRHFHPSDEGGSADWNRFAIDAVKRVEGAGSPADLAALLESTFQSLAPSVRVYTGAAPTLPLSGGPQVVRWHNKGFDTGRQVSVYKRTRDMKAGTSCNSRIYAMDLGRGVGAGGFRRQ